MATIKREEVETPLEFLLDDTLAFIVTFKDSSGTPVDLTGYTATLRFTGTAAGGPFAHSNMPDGITVDGPAGRVDVTISTNYVRSLANDGAYRLYVVDPSGNKTTLLLGPYTKRLL